MGSSAITSSDTTKTLFWRMQNLPHCWIVLDNLLVLFTHKATIIMTPKPPRRNAERNRHLQTYRCSKTLQFKRKVHMTDVFHAYTCSLCPKIYISMGKESKRRRERQIERKNKNTSDQQIRDWNKYSSAKTCKIKHLRSVQHFLAGITLREQHEHGIRWRIPKNAKSHWKCCSNFITILKMPKRCMLIH